MRRAIFRAALGLCGLLGCGPSWPAPSRSGPAPEYIEPTAQPNTADASAAAENPEFAQQLEDALHNAAVSMDSCRRDEEARSGAAARGSVTLHLVLAPDGRVVEIESRNDAGLSQTMLACLRDALQSATFPAAGGDRNLPVQLPLQFGVTESTEKPE